MEGCISAGIPLQVLWRLGTHEEAHQIQIASLDSYMKRLMESYQPQSDTQGNQTRRIACIFGLLLEQEFNHLSGQLVDDVLCQFRRMLRWVCTHHVEDVPAVRKRVSG